MVFIDKLTIAASIAVIAALWAAVIGAILVTKFRRQADTAEAKSRDLRLVYELQLEREITARRQYELDVETTIRKEVAAESGQELLELQAQVAALRASLELLLGEPLPEERVALPSEKLRELASGIGSNLYAPDDRVMAAHDFASTAPATADGRHQPSGDARYDIPRAAATDMTEIIPVVTDDEEIISTQFEQVVAEPAPTQAYVAPQPDPNQPQFTEDAPTDAWLPDPGAPGPAAPQPAAQQQNVQPSEADLEDSIGKHDDGTGVPFSQLLTQLQQVSPGSGGRRRKDD